MCVCERERERERETGGRERWRVEGEKEIMDTVFELQIYNKRERADK